MRLLKVLLASALMWAPGNILADKIVECTPDPSAYITLLNAAGYEMISYDISSTVNETYNIRLVIREYAADSLVNDGESGYTPVMRNRRMLSEFSEEDQANIVKENRLYDASRGIYKAGERINVGFLPARDSKNGGKEIPMMFDIPDIGSFFSYLKLRPIYQPGGDADAEGMYSYHIRPFNISEFTPGEFTPLALLGSMWYDPQFQIFRFCGENVINPDLSSLMLKYIPHYYIIGVIITPKN